jgi:hypothetical protein
MAKRIQFRRGTTAQHAAFVGAPGEITVDTDKNVIVVHNGVKPGGFPASRLESVDGAVTFTGQVSVNATTPSTSTTTGALVVAGGLGVNSRITCVNLIETSSIAFKENVNPITGALDSIMQLVGTTYDRKDTKENEPGLIAEEVNKILPGVVSKDDDGNPYGIKYTKLIAYLIEAVKEQQEQINDLKKKV